MTVRPNWVRSRCATFASGTPRCVCSRTTSATTSGPSCTLAAPSASEVCSRWRPWTRRRHCEQCRPRCRSAARWGAPPGDLPDIASPPGTARRAAAVRTRAATGARQVSSTCGGRGGTPAGRSAHLRAGPGRPPRPWGRSLTKGAACRNPARRAASSCCLRCSLRRFHRSRSPFHRSRSPSTRVNSSRSRAISRSCSSMRESRGSCSVRGRLPWHPHRYARPLEKYKSTMLDLARHETTPLNKYSLFWPSNCCTPLVASLIYGHTVIVLEVGQIFNASDVRQAVGCSCAGRIGGHSTPHGTVPLRRIIECPRQGRPMPPCRERSDDLVEHGNGDLAELYGVLAMSAENFTRNGEKCVDAVQGGLLVTIFCGQWLRYNSRQHLDVQFPCGVGISVL